MSAIGLVLAIALLIFGIALIAYACNLDDGIAISSLIGTIMCIAGIIILALSIQEDKPSAIDVYNGKTRLQITYQDTIPIDTVVVWKDEFKSKK